MHFKNLIVPGNWKSFENQSILQSQSYPNQYYFLSQLIDDELGEHFLVESSLFEEDIFFSNIEDALSFVANTDEQYITVKEGIFN